MSNLLARFSVVALLAALPSSAPAADTVACGGEVHGAAVLTADLDCSAAPDPTVYLYGASLDLGGFTLTANVRCTREEVTALSDLNCGIRGPGNLHGCVDASARLKLANASFTYDAGVCAATVDESIRAWDIKASDVTISDYPSYIGVIGGKIIVMRSIVQNVGGPDGILAGSDGSLLILDSTITASGTVMSGGPRSKVKIIRTTIDDSNWSGVAAVGGRILLVDSSVTDSASVGVDGPRVRIRNSQVTGSCLEDFVQCADISTTSRPRLPGSTCGTSICTDPPGTCGVCTND